MSAPLDTKDLWTAAGVLLGFQATAFSWRVTHESSFADTNVIDQETNKVRNIKVWLAPSDYLNIFAILVTTIGLFLLPALGADKPGLSQILLGLSTLLFIGHLLTLAGHYELYGKGQIRSRSFFPKQEKIAMIIALFICFIYISVALIINWAALF